MEDLERVHKVTILARGRTGGHALVVPEDDKSLMTRADMIARIVMAMGGRAAEEYIFGEPTSGASSDIEQATRIARAMVAEYGMSAKLGAVKYGNEGGDPFLGRGGGAGADYSPEIAKTIDDEVRRIIDAAHTEAWRVLEANREILDAVAGELLEKETLRQDDLARLFADVVKRPRLTEFDDFGGRVPSTEPPIKTPGELAKERGEPWPPPVTDPFAMPVLPSGREPGGVDAGDVNGTDPAPGGMTGTGRGAQRGQVPAGSLPTGIPAYGTPPPPGWSAPGWPPRGTAPVGGGVPDGGPAPDGGNGPTGAETTRLPAAPGPRESPGGAPGEGSGEDDPRSDPPVGSAGSTRAWSAVDGNGRRSGSRRREDKDPGWRAPWERED